MLELKRPPSVLLVTHNHPIRVFCSRLLKWLFPPDFESSFSDKLTKDSGHTPIDPIPRKYFSLISVNDLKWMVIFFKVNEPSIGRDERDEL